MNVQTDTFRPVPAEDVAWLGTDPIPAAAYYDPDFFELERQAIFMRSWLQIGHISEIAAPDSFIRRELEFAKASLLIVHGKDGKIRAFHNVCTHRGTQLVQAESGKASSFTCPYHAWTFGQDGALRSAPDFDRFYVDKADCSLREVAVDVCAGLIFVNLNPNPAQSLHDYLGPLGAQMETVPVAKAGTFFEYVYDVEANWKLTYDNFQENYHLRFIHPSTGGPGLAPENPYGYPERYGFYGPHRTQTIWSNPAPEITPLQGFMFGKAAEIAAAEGLFDSPTVKEYFALFPNFFMFGSPMQNFSQTVYPISATRSRSVIRIYWVGEEDCASKRFVREFLTATVRDIHAEDVSVIEAGQRGLSSGALKHIHFQAQESLCRHLFNCVNERVEAYKAERKTAGEAA